MTQRTPRRVATTVWAALFAGSTMFLGVALFLVVGLRGGVGIGEPRAASALIGASAGLSVVTVALSWLWAVRMRIAHPAQGSVAPRGAVASAPAGPEANALARLTVACALCEGGALFAVIAFLLTGHLLALATYALSWFALAAHFPGDRHWAQLSGVPVAAPRNPMTRG